MNVQTNIIVFVILILVELLVILCSNFIKCI